MIMIGLLIYDTIGAKRNEWFINSLITNFKNYDIDLRLAIIKKNQDIDQEVDRLLNGISNLSFAIVRTIAPKINFILEKKSIKVFNNYNTSFIANDKWKTYLLCRKLGIPTMPTYHNINSISLQDFPYIIKSSSGHGGVEVFFANNIVELNEYKDAFYTMKKCFVIQKPCTDLGSDMRIYMLGNEIIASVLRYNIDDFRSNYSLGGNVKIAIPTNYQIEIVKKIVSHLKCDYVGVDFIFDNGKWVLNEIEDVVGARMLYKVTNIDIVSKYCFYIKEYMKNYKKG